MTRCASKSTGLVGSLKWFRDGLGVWRQARVVTATDTSRGVEYKLHEQLHGAVLVRPGYTVDMLYDEKPEPREEESNVG